MRKAMVCLCFLLAAQAVRAQTYPVFGPPIAVTINGLGFDAMEPHLSHDGNVLFFNNANDGLTTGLYYATRVNDSVFDYAGPLNGANQTVTPRLDAVASMDRFNQFFWISTRNYPTEYHNVFHGQFTGSDVMAIGRIQGDFYIYTPGWLIMDAAVNDDGQYLCYTNANLAGCGGLPCEAHLGIAQKINDSTFNKIPASDSLLRYVNDTAWVTYAPLLSPDGLELYFSRFPKTGFSYTQLCVSVRSHAMDTFSLPAVIESSGLIPEASTLSYDQSRMYYHRTSGSLRKIFMRYRTGTSGINEKNTGSPLCLFPNPARDHVYLDLPQASESFFVKIYDTNGKQVLAQYTTGLLSLTALPAGTYLLVATAKKQVFTAKLIKT